MKQFVTQLFFLFIKFYFSNCIFIDLGGKNVWRFYSSSNRSFFNPQKAINVPGDIYTDLKSVGVFNNSLLFGENDQVLRWIAQETWIYERNFNVSSKTLKHNTVLLHITGLDTIARVYINGFFLMQSENQFRKWIINIENRLIHKKENLIQIIFVSPLKYSKAKERAYKANYFHSIPPLCPNNIQNGECHVNFLRKVQSSFSWDWAPSFPTIGIWKPIFLEVFPYLSIVEFSPLPIFVNDSFKIQAIVSLECSFKQKFVNVTSRTLRLLVSIDELKILKIYEFTNIKCGKTMSKNYLFNVTLHLPHNVTVERWYPRGYGNQKLYLISTAVSFNEKFEIFQTKKIGFRTVNLIQDLIDSKSPQKGRTFYFEVNNVPIFLKGSNWVPISAFPAQNHTIRQNFLFNSMVQANFNCLRVWGGGMYEFDNFYDQADNFGILIWQDFMFACALYPTNENFLNNVKSEIRQQVIRLRHHASILLYTGNNENELGISKNWFFEPNYNYDAKTRDYIALYRDVVKPIVKSLDTSRPILLSSPSNGIYSETKIKNNKISKFPNNPAYGDIHFYNEFQNLWNDQSYKIPRCATEYGVQSIPFQNTMENWIEKKEMHYISKSFNSRQHHPGGAITQLLFISQHFDILKTWNSNNSLKSFFNTYELNKIAFYSQIHQAIAVQTQTEHYRRWRSDVNEQGLGKTMCAMYWQLNDVWAAPSWSSIDYDLNWKMLHYFARRFFNPVIISMYLNNERNNLNLIAVSDKDYIIKNASVTLNVFLIKGKFIPLHTATKTFDFLPHCATKLNFTSIIQKLFQITPNVNDLMFHADVTIFNDTKTSIYPATLLPNVFKIDEKSIFKQVFIEKLFLVSELEYHLKLKSLYGVVSLVWIEFKVNEVKKRFILKNRVKIQLNYYFDDNAFSMITPNRIIKLFLFPNFPNETIIFPYPLLNKNDFRLLVL